MKAVSWQKLGVAVAFLVQFAALFFWGGGVNEKVDTLQADFARYTQSVRETNRQQTQDINDLRSRVSVAEVVAQACVNGQVADGNFQIPEQE